MGQKTTWVCDNCGKEDSFGDMHPPPNWVQINVPGMPPRWLCSADCLSGEAAKLKKDKTLERHPIPELPVRPAS